MTDYRSLEIKVSHARNLKKVNFLSDMDPYVVVSISTDPRNRLRTPTHKTGNKNPTWNFSIKFAVDVAASRLGSPILRFEILCERSLGNKPIGDVRVPLVDLLGSVDENKAYHVAYQVRRPSGRAKGELNFSYQWLSGAPPQATAPPLPMEGKVDDVVTAYPLVAGTSSGNYAPEPALGYKPYDPYHTAPHGGYEHQYPPVGYASHQLGYPSSHEYGGYPPPPHHGGYPPPPHHDGYLSPGAGHGYPPVQPLPRKKNNKTGMGLAVGLLGGLLVGDLLF